jgi:NADPH-dependent ferric siderophore reductase
MLTGERSQTRLGAMSTRAQRYDAVVLSRARISPHLLRLTLSVPGLESTGIADEWVGLVVPGQFQVRYYTVRSLDGDRLVIDVVVHEEGLVTGWASGDCEGDRVVVTGAQGSFDPPEDAAWLLLVGDLTAMPAMARIAETATGWSSGPSRRSSGVETRIWAEVPDDLTGYLPDGVDVTWLEPPAEGQSRLAEVVEGIDWPAGEGYFWMAGESAQMRAIRKHLMRERRLPSTAYDVMGYWRAVAARQPRSVDPGPIWQAGKAAGHSDEQIWAAYDEARGG